MSIIIYVIHSGNAMDHNNCRITTAQTLEKANKVYFYVIFIKIEVVSMLVNQF